VIAWTGGEFLGRPDAARLNTAGSAIGAVP
jgi:hypothetical protein